MAYMEADIEYKLSGGALNASVFDALGGVISYAQVVTSLFENLFDDVTSGEATAGSIEYRCFYVENTGDTSMTGSVIYISSDTTSASTVLDIGLDAAGLNGTATTIANETTAPGSVTFTHPTTPGSGLSLGTLAADDFYAVWVRRTVTAAAPASTLDTGEITVEVTI